ncbi:hypothetical protein, partial [Paraeggerthella hominis]|uniref:hypothetical protein n=1 Tax=Paraeggerthella hominis TaxID=2897351 RepID=UPI003D148A20
HFAFAKRLFTDSILKNFELFQISFFIAIVFAHYFSFQQQAGNPAPIRRPFGKPIGNSCVAGRFP